MENKGYVIPMSIAKHIDKRVSLRVEAREREESQFTEGCLISTCPLRSTHQARHGRSMRLSDCPVTCCYHPEHPDQNSPGRNSGVSE